MVWETAIGSMIASAIGAGSAQRVNTENIEFNRQQAELARQFSSDEADKARDWAKNMSDTAHQREVADLKSAGINPLYAVKGGATTPSPVMASSAKGETGISADPSRHIGNAVNSAVEAYKESKASKLIDKQIGIAEQEEKIRGVDVKAKKSDLDVKLKENAWKKKLTGVNQVGDTIGKYVRNVGMIAGSALGFNMLGRVGKQLGRRLYEFNRRSFNK